MMIDCHLFYSLLSCLINTAFVSEMGERQEVLYCVALSLPPLGKEQLLGSPLSSGERGGGQVFRQVC